MCVCERFVVDCEKEMATGLLFGVGRKVFDWMPMKSGMNNTI